MTFYAQSKTRTIDFDITLTAVEKAVFGDTKEGTFALRVASGPEEPHADAPAQPARTGHLVDSEGRQGEKEVWGKRASWADYYGVVDGEPLGIAIFDNPSNPRHPTWWHARSYGLFAANIFGLHDFENDKSKDGSLTLAPGEKLRFRYRCDSSRRCPQRAHRSFTRTTARDGRFSRTMGTIGPGTRFLSQPHPHMAPHLAAEV